MEDGSAVNDLVLVRRAVANLVEKHPVFVLGGVVCSSAAIAAAAGVVVVVVVAAVAGGGGDVEGGGVPVGGEKGVPQGEGEVELASRRGGEVGDRVGEADLGGEKPLEERLVVRRQGVVVGRQQPELFHLPARCGTERVAGAAVLRRVPIADADADAAGAALLVDAAQNPIIQLQRNAINRSIERPRSNRMRSNF